MKTATLFRMPSSVQGTIGVLTTPGFSCRTIELPWKQNEPNISCIPTGEYEVEMRKSPRFGWVYWVKEVPRRSWILTHYGNVAGDVSAGFKTHSLGCIILGKIRGRLYGQEAVLVSRSTLNAFIKYMAGEQFKLIIENI
jgi:hypothetical protein